VLCLKLIGAPGGHRAASSITPSGPSVFSGSPSVYGSQPATAKPPFVLPPDEYGATCGSGIAAPERGWPTRGGRGTPPTACAFAFNVLKGYQGPHPSPGDTAPTITVESVVPCPDTGSQCVGLGVEVNCANHGDEAWITCTDGGSDGVYLF
jgi:hypothetical protein